MTKRQSSEQEKTIANKTTDKGLISKLNKQLIQFNINAFKLWCCRRLLRDTWIVWRSNQSILKETNPDYSLDGLMLKLNLQHFDHLMQRVNSLGKTMMLGKIEGSRRRG